MGAVEEGAREQRRHGQPGKLDPPAHRPQGPLPERREGHGDHRPREHGADHQQHRGGEGEEPADPGKAHQPERQLVAGQRGGAAPLDAFGDLPRIRPRRRGERAPSGGPLARRHQPCCACIGAKSGEHRESRRHEHDGLPRLQRAQRVLEGMAAGDAVRLEGGERDPGGVVDGHPRSDSPQRDLRRPRRPPRTETPEGTEAEPDEDHHQPAQHVQLGVQVHDHISRFAASVEQVVDRRECLHGTLKRAECQRPAAGEHEGACRPPGRKHGAHDDGQEQPERREHRDAGAHDQEGMERRRPLRLLRRQSAVDEPPLVQAEVQRRAVEGERAEQQREEAGVREPARQLCTAERREEREQAAGDDHRQTGDEVDVRMADRIDPLARVTRAIEPVRVRRLHLDHALHRPDRERDRTGRHELPQMPLRLRDLHEPRLEDRQANVGGEAPVAETHDPGAHARRHLVPLAHVLLGEPVVPTVLDEPSDRDPVADERDVEERQPDCGEPERALGQALAGERPADDARQDEPAEPGREQRAAADDHHVRVREVSDQVAGIAHARQRLGHPRDVLDDHVHAAEHEEERTAEEVLRDLAVVRGELFLGVRLEPKRWLPPRYVAEENRDDNGEKRRVRHELERREVLEVHASGARVHRSPGSKK